ncbi:MAG TPA: GMC family oxidoreductase [Solirubrobacterales bacterium]|nr:GMC family oxidoreductase [Solirubrobacterales bacterium]
MKTADVIVVGAGAAGGWAAKELSERGLVVTVLDAGPLDPTPDGTGLSRRPIQSHCYACTEADAHLFVDDLDNPYEVAPGTSFSWLRGRQVGGRLLTWGLTSPRMEDDEFKAASVDGVGEDWPISAADLAPAYARVEEFLDVRRAPLNEPERRLAEVVEARWPTRRVEASPKACREPLRPLEAALATGRVTLRAETIAERLLVGAGGDRVTGVAMVDRRTGTRDELQARAVVLCASALESTRLLLNWAGDHHPDGLANSSGALGRYLMDHTSGVYFEGRVPHGAESTAASPSEGGILAGFRNVTESVDGFHRGYEVEFQALPGAPRRRRLRRDTRETFWMSAFGEMLPDPENRVEIDPARTDAWGIPTLRIDARHSENERAMARDQVATLREMLDAAGFEITGAQTELAPLGMAAHEMGTARMGADPATSVLNPWNQTWDVPNLLVTDAASFTSSGYRNPTLTIMALTVRACTHLADLLEGGEP